METRRDPPSSLRDSAEGQKSLPIPSQWAASTLLVGASSLASRLLGFVRDMLMAWLLGGGPLADALVLALRLPHVLRRLLGEGSLSMTLTARFIHCRTGQTAPPAKARFNGDTQPADEGIAASFALAWAVSLRIALFLGLFIVAAELAARPLLSLLAPGLALQNAGGTDTILEAVSLFRICLPYAFAAGMAALGMAFLHSLGNFLWPALSPLCFNTVIIIFALLAAGGVGDPAVMLACGFLAGGLAQCLLPCLALWRLRLWRYRLPAPAPETIRACLHTLPLGLLGAAAPQLALLCAMGAASFLPAGSISALYYAERLLELPMSVTGTALGMVSLPTLTALTARGEHRAFSVHCSTALRLSLLLALPATAGLWAVGELLIAVLLGHGAFDNQAVHHTALALYGYACSLPLYALNRPLLAACNAHKASRATAMSGLCAVLTTLMAAVVLLLIVPPAYAVLGPPLAVGCGLALQNLLLWRSLRQSLPAFCTITVSGRSLGKMLLASLLTFAAASFTAKLLTPIFAAPLGVLTASVLTGIVVYILCLLFLRHEDTKNCIRWWKHRSDTQSTRGK